MAISRGRSTDPARRFTIETSLDYVESSTLEMEENHDACFPFEIDSTLDITEPIPLIKQKDTNSNIFTRGGMSLILGYAKSRKTFLVSALAAVALGKQNFGLEANEKGYKVAICDTEEGVYFASRVKGRIHRLMGWNPKKNYKRLKYYDLRVLDATERTNEIVKIVDSFHPDILFIDGIVDCCLDFNSPKDAGNIINLLLKIAATKDVHICVVLHTNKDKTTAKGHLGSLLLAKVETGLEVKFKGSYSEVKPAANSCRHLPFTPFCFGIDEHGLPYLTGTRVASQEEALFEDIKKDIKDLFDSSTDDCLKRQYILDVITRDDRVSRDKARKNILKQLMYSNFLKKVRRGYYTLGPTPLS